MRAEERQREDFVGASGSVVLPFEVGPGVLDSMLDLLRQLPKGFQVLPYRLEVELLGFPLLDLDGPLWTSKGIKPVAITLLLVGLFQSLSPWPSSFAIFGGKQS